MARVWRVLILSLGFAGCGGFLGSSGDDDDDEGRPPVPEVADGSLDGRDDEGGSNVTRADAGDGGKDVTLNSDGSTDAKTDVGTDAPNVGLTPKYVFVTSTAVTGSFGAGGEVAAAADADIICKAHADASTLAKMQGRIWRAWISTATPPEDAASRIDGASSFFRLPDDILVAASYGDLVDGSLAHAINKDESGNELGDLPVWTGSTAAGALASDHCSNWNTAMAAATGRVGTTASQSAGWSDNADLGCMQTARLYCFQQ